jgi:hypothetical protein
MFHVKNVDARYYIIPSQTCGNKLNKTFLNSLIRGFWMRSTMILLDLLTVSSACANYSAVETSAVGLRLHQKVRERGQVLLEIQGCLRARRTESQHTEDSGQTACNSVCPPICTLRLSHYLLIFRISRRIGGISNLVPKPVSEFPVAP